MDAIPPRASRTLGGGPVRGRDHHLARVGEHLASLQAGSGSVLTIAGEPGAGKTRLLTEAARMAGRSDVRVAHAAGDRQKSVAPLSLLTTALFDGADPLLDRSVLSDLEDPPAQRYWLVHQLGMLLEEAASHGPICICLDDLQWADRGTIASLRVLPRRLVSTPILWIGAVRARQASAGALAALEEIGHERVELEPLDDAAVCEVVTDILGAEPSDELLELAGNAKGVPFFLQELVLGLLEEDLVRIESDGANLIEARLPDRVREGMVERLARLSDSARRTALVASVLGAEFSFEDLALAREISPGALLDPVDELTSADILIETAGALAFRHEITRQAVFDAVPRSARRALQRQAAEVLLSSGALPVEVASQLEASAEPGDESAVATLRKAAQSLASSDPGIAADLSLRALDLTLSDGSERAALIAETALLLHASGRVEEGREFVRGALQGAFAAEEEAEILLSIAGMLALSPDVRVEASTAALALTELPTGLRAAHLARRVRNLLAAGRPSEALARLPEATAVAENAERFDADIALTLANGALATVKGDFASALGHMRDAARQCRQTHEIAERFLAEEWAAEQLVSLDQMDGALRLSDDLLRAAQRGHQPLEVRVIESFQARMSLMLGRLADTAALLDDRFRFEDAESIVGVREAAALLAFGRAALHTGNEWEARRATEIASRVLTYDVPGVRRQAIWMLALGAMADGDASTAHQHLCRMGMDERLSLLPLFPVDVTDEVHLARIALAAGDQELAAVAVAGADTRAGLNPGVTTIAGTAMHVHGLMDDDSEKLHDAAREFEGGPRPLATASALEDAGVSLVRNGRRDDAISSLDKALEIYAETGAVRDETRVRGRLRTLGVRRRLVSPKRPATGWEALTESELAVATLVAEGMTNRQVASRLYISPHTVGTHLRHAFSKLGVNSRVDLTRIALASGPSPGPGDGAAGNGTRGRGTHP